MNKPSKLDIEAVRFGSYFAAQREAERVRGLQEKLAAARNRRAACDEEIANIERWLGAENETA